jgi:hypothetical protein
VLLRLCHNEAARERLHRPVWLRTIVRVALNRSQPPPNQQHDDPSSSANASSSSSSSSAAFAGFSSSSSSSSVSLSFSEHSQMLALRVLRFLLPALSPTNEVLLEAVGCTATSTTTTTTTATANGQSGQTPDPNVDAMQHAVASSLSAPEHAFLSFIFTLIGRSIVASHSEERPNASPASASATFAFSPSASATAAASVSSSSSSSSAFTANPISSAIAAELVSLLRVVLASELWNAVLCAQLNAHAAQLPFIAARATGTATAATAMTPAAAVALKPLSTKDETAKTTASTALESSSSSSAALLHDATALQVESDALYHAVAALAVLGGSSNQVCDPMRPDTRTLEPSPFDLFLPCVPYL